MLPSRGLLIGAAAIVLGACAPGGQAGQTPAPGIRKPSPSAPPSSGALVLTGLRMVSRNVGWGLAQPSESGLSHLVRTTDGGTNWHAVELPPTLNTPNLDAVDFHDEENAWIFVMLGAESTSSHETAVVASTSDGGQHWRTSPKFTIDGHGTGVQFIDTAHGWAFATPSAGGVIGAGDTTLYRTVDAGAHWQAIKPASEVRQDPAVVPGLPEACPLGGAIGQPVFTDGQSGWLGAFCRRIFFYVSHDGGLSWHPQALPTFPGPVSSVSPADLQYNVDSFQRISSADFVVFVHRGITTGGNALQDAAIYRSEDAGQSWSAYRLPYPELTADFIDASHGWMTAAGPGGDIEHITLYSTVDAGQSWRIAGNQVGTPGATLQFMDPNVGFLVIPSVAGQPGRILRSSDAGATWQPLALSIN